MVIGILNMLGQEFILLGSFVKCTCMDVWQSWGGSRRDSFERIHV